MIPNFITAAARRPAGRRSTATASSRATSPTSTTSSRPTCSPMDAEGVARPASTTSPAASASRLNRAARASCRARSARDIEPVHAPAAAGDVRHSLADLTRRDATLGYEPSVDLREGLRRTIEPLRDRSRSGGLTPARLTRRPGRLVRVISRLNIGGPAIQAITLTERLGAARLRHGARSRRERAARGDRWTTSPRAGGAPVGIPALRRELGPTT